MYLMESILEARRSYVALMLTSLLTFKDIRLKPKFHSKCCGSYEIVPFEANDQQVLEI